LASWEIIMHKLSIATAVAFLAASLVYVVPWHRAETPLASVSPHELTLATPAMAAGQAPDAF
jgi:hypothetical protein